MLTVLKPVCNGLGFPFVLYSWPRHTRVAQGEYEPHTESLPHNLAVVRDYDPVTRIRTMG